MHERLIHTVLVLGFASLSSAAADADQTNRANRTTTIRQNDRSAALSSPKKLGLNEGIVEEVDFENQSLVIKHGRIQSKTIAMGPMTMPFNVANASLLLAVKVGDRVKFDAENVHGMPTLTAIKRQR